MEQQNESVSLEERQSVSVIVMGESDALEAGKENNSGVPTNEAKKKKTLEVEWKPVARARRKTKFFSFCEVFGGKAEVETWALARSQQVTGYSVSLLSSLPPCRFPVCLGPGGQH